MAKVKSIVTISAPIGSVMATQQFNSVNTVNQVGDRFFVPNANLLLVLGNAVEETDRNGNVIVDDAGNPNMRQVGQHFCAVRMVDDVPTEVVELYVGQIVKVDVNRRFVFPGVLSNALRRGDSAFKEAICNHILEITGEQMCQDRVWDSERNQYKRDENDKFVPQEKLALQFEPKVHNLKHDIVEKCLDMLIDYYRENYKEFIKE